MCAGTAQAAASMLPCCPGKQVWGAGKDGGGGGGEGMDAYICTQAEGLMVGICLSLNILRGRYICEPFFSIADSGWVHCSTKCFLLSFL